jgi:hypothetical protein
LSVLTRIRIVGAFATSLVSALGLFAMFWLVSFPDLPGVQSDLLVGALLMGLALLTASCVLMALSIGGGQRRIRSNHALELRPAEGSAFDSSPVEVGRI